MQWTWSQYLQHFNPFKKFIKNVLFQGMQRKIPSEISGFIYTTSVKLVKYVVKVSADLWALVRILLYFFFLNCKISNVFNIFSIIYNLTVTSTVSNTAVVLVKLMKSRSHMQYSTAGQRKVKTDFGDGRILGQ